MRLLIRGPVAPFRVLASGVFLLFACATLGGCLDVAGDPANADARPQFVRRGDANMAGATLAVVSVEGAPADLTEHFNQRLAEAAAARQVTVAAPAQARYLVRGYLTASLVEGGAAVEGMAGRLVSVAGSRLPVICCRTTRLKCRGNVSSGTEG